MGRFIRRIEWWVFCFVLRWVSSCNVSSNWNVWRISSHTRKCRACLRLRVVILFPAYHLGRSAGHFNPNMYITLCIRHRCPSFCIYCITAHITTPVPFLPRNPTSCEILSDDSAVGFVEKVEHSQKPFEEDITHLVLVPAALHLHGHLSPPPPHFSFLRQTPRQPTCRAELPKGHQQRRRRPSQLPHPLRPR